MNEININGQIVSAVSTQLQEEYGKKGFDEITPSRGATTPDSEIAGDC